ncbi:MAG: hypothetical protein J6W40_01630 [Alphaproteobacteria bacterium]|nr:hypothetical protein [Alphaproteobacteria bacterium]
MKFLVRDDGILPDLSGLVAKLRDAEIPWTESYYYDQDGKQRSDKPYEPNVYNKDIYLQETYGIWTKIIPASTIKVECEILGGVFNNNICIPPSSKHFIVKRFDPSNNYMPIFDMVDTNTRQQYKQLCATTSDDMNENVWTNEKGVEYCWCRSETMYWHEKSGCALRFENADMAAFYCSEARHSSGPDPETNACICNTINKYGVDEPSVNTGSRDCVTCSSMNAIHISGFGLNGMCQKCPDKVDVEHNTCVTSCADNQIYLETNPGEYNNTKLCLPKSDTERCSAHDDSVVSQSGNLCIIFGIGENACKDVASQDGGVFWQHWQANLNRLGSTGMLITEDTCLYILGSVYKRMSAVCTSLGGTPVGENCENINVSSIPSNQTCEEYVSSVYTEWPIHGTSTEMTSGHITKCSFGFLSHIPEKQQTYVAEELRGTCFYPGMDISGGRCQCQEGYGVDYRHTAAELNEIGCEPCDSSASDYFYFGCGN